MIHILHATCSTLGDCQGLKGKRVDRLRADECASVNVEITDQGFHGKAQPFRGKTGPVSILKCSLGLRLSYECSNPVYGQTLNPYDSTRGPGGSSGGEGALIGSNGSLLGIGTEQRPRFSVKSGNLFRETQEKTKKRVKSKSGKQLGFSERHKSFHGKADAGFPY